MSNNRINQALVSNSTLSNYGSVGGSGDPRDPLLDDYLNTAQSDDLDRCSDFRWIFFLLTMGFLITGSTIVLLGFTSDVNETLSTKTKTLFGLGSGLLTLGLLSSGMFLYTHHQMGRFESIVNRSERARRDGLVPPLGANI